MNAVTWVAHHLLDAALMSASMFWDVAWSLVLGFVISGLLQVVVSQERLQRTLGGNGLRQVALATGFGAASSSCSYASAAISRTLFSGGAGLVPSLAFLIASTNLVVELGVVLWLLMGWQFTAAEWMGGLVLIGIMWALVRLTYPAGLAEEARAHAAGAGGHGHPGPPVPGDTLWQKLQQPANAGAGRTKRGDGRTHVMERSRHRLRRGRCARRVRAAAGLVAGVPARQRALGAECWATR